MERAGPPFDTLWPIGIRIHFVFSLLYDMLVWVMQNACGGGAYLEGQSLLLLGFFKKVSSY